MIITSTKKKTMAVHTVLSVSSVSLSVLNDIEDTHSIP